MIVNHTGKFRLNKTKKCLRISKTGKFMHVAIIIPVKITSTYTHSSIKGLSKTRKRQKGGKKLAIGVL